MTANLRRRLDYLEAAHRMKRSELIVVETTEQAQAFRDRMTTAARSGFMPVVIVTGVPRSPGDPLSSSTHQGFPHRFNS